MYFDHDELDVSVWNLVKQQVVYDCEPLGDSVDKHFLLSPPVAERFACVFLQDRHQSKSYQILDSDQLWAISQRQFSEADVDVDDAPGIYVFVSILSESILKVGQAERLRKRICDGHLRYGYQTTESKLIDYCKARWDWPSALREQEICCIYFTSKEDRKGREFIEFALHQVLAPEMP